MNNRILGAIAMICAPAMFFGFLLEDLLLRGQENVVVTGITGSVFMGGWICANIGMQRMRAAGTSKWGVAVLLIQLAGLVLAFVFGLLEATGLLEGTIIFNITDAAWPLSMLWMLVVGVTVIVAKRLSGWKRFVPVLCPLWLPISLVGSAAFGEAAGYVGLGFMAVLWTLLGYIVRDSQEQVITTPEPAVH